MRGLQTMGHTWPMLNSTWTQADCVISHFHRKANGFAKSAETITVLLPYNMTDAIGNAGRVISKPRYRQVTILDDYLLVAALRQITLSSSNCVTTNLQYLGLDKS